MCIFWGRAGIPAELIIQHSLDGFSVFLCYKHDKDQTVQCPGWSFSSVEWMKAPKMIWIPRAPSKEHAGKSLAESADTPRCGRECSVHPSAPSFTAPGLQHWKLGKKIKKSIFGKLGLNKPQELSIDLRQPGQGKGRRCPDQEKVGGVRWVENVLSCCFSFLKSQLR